MILMCYKVHRTRTRVCDERCYNAIGPTCKGKGTICLCICRGINHGVGEDQARRNMREVFAPLIAAYPERGFQAVYHQEKLFKGMEQ